MILPDPEQDLPKALWALNELHRKAKQFPASWAVFQHAHPQIGPWVRAVAEQMDEQHPDLPAVTELIPNLLPGVIVPAAKETA